MSTQSDVEQFLHDFKLKMSIWGLLIFNRQKNEETFLSLEITNSYVTEILKSLQYVDYSEGPVDEVVNLGSPMWIFGKNVKGQEIYIKLSLGKDNGKPFCISFHPPLYSMNYPFKT